VFEQCGLDKFIARPGGSGRGVETSLKETPRGSVLIDEQSRTEMSGNNIGINWEENALIAVDTIITQQESSINFKALSSAKLSKKSRDAESEETKCKRPAQSFIRCSQPKTWIHNAVINNKAANGTLGRALVVIIPQQDPPTIEDIKLQRFKKVSKLLLSVNEIERIRNVALDHTGYRVYELFDDRNESVEVTESYMTKVPEPTVLKVTDDAYEILIQFEYIVGNSKVWEEVVIGDVVDEKEVDNKVTEIQRYACNRVTELVYRICVIFGACSKDKTVTKEMAEWAIGFVTELKTIECNFFESELDKAQKEIDKENEEKALKEAMDREKAREAMEELRYRKTKQNVVDVVAKYGKDGTPISNIRRYSRSFRSSDPDTQFLIIHELVSDTILKVTEKKLENDKVVSFYSLV
jgi:hypothetical protein